MPTLELPPVTPFTLHVTDVLAEFATAAVNVCVKPTGTLATTGVTEIDTGALIVTSAVAYLVVSDVQTAFTGTTFGDGTDAGGVYTPEVEIDPFFVSPPKTSLTYQDTPVSVVLLTSALKV